ncbi:hypothetical protein D8O27_26735 [Burkholderia mallei]|uniref:Uncharacterized protein n=1 Tax=Burkholderia mallei (strain ATCC 23344) TaxID=243160 RepID=A0A0H2WIX7_BURMA|nr:hypothetical protein BMA1028 [Burkholderia mallei ATCC 23344]RKN92779.1 hypothetical protein D8O31_26815 [Burkholderia mallei]RKN93573.1 hypothetical protein D8O03_26970 [Burkholderia mallei]RKN96338.1 hypothetical protein D8O05_26105 [Burkholderia mallei]RKO08661.1 hypothetical protein D8O04_27135 [Burkholderia mallei]
MIPRTERAARFARRFPRRCMRACDGFFTTFAVSCLPCRAMRVARPPRLARNAPFGPAHTGRRAVRRRGGPARHARSCAPARG